MPILHRDVTQYSEQYDKLKLGIPTSSHFHKILTHGGKPSDQWAEYAYVLIAERLLQRKIDFYRSAAMERGLIVEAEAVAWYEFDHDITTEPIGFITNDERTIGCTPDRLVGDDGLLEAKAPLPHTQVRYLVSGKLAEHYRPQLQGQLYVSEREWVDIACWHDVLPKIVLRMERDDKYIAALESQLQTFNYFIERVMEKIGSASGEPVPQNRGALRRALRASLEAT